MIRIGTRYHAKSKTNEKRRQIHGARGRLGMAIVEMAIVLPIFVTIALATIDTCRVIYIRHSAKIAAYECARIVVFPGATEANLQTQCDAIMTERKLKDYSCVLPAEHWSTLVM